jgi:folate-binding protein YgfZ
VATVKGKILSDLWVSAVDESELLIVVPAVRSELLLEHFDRFIIMEDVELIPVAAEVLSVQGPGSRTLVAQSLASESLASQALGTTFTYPAARLGTEGVDWLIEPHAMPHVTGALVDAGARPGSVAEWETRRFQNQIPAFGVDFDDQNYPQEAQILDRAVSLSKGCYVGQEVICMLQNRGKVSRRLVMLETDGGLWPGEVLASTEGTPVGTIKSVSPAGGRAFALVKAAFGHEGTELRSEAGEPVRVVPSNQVIVT